jgi:hypothetical protein
MRAKFVLENVRETDKIQKPVSKRIEKALDKAQDFYENSRYYNFTKDEVRVEYGLEELEDGDTSLFINDISTHPYYQHKGYASKVLREICNYGDNNDLPISLRASIGGHYSSPTRMTQDMLIKWYEKFGFILSPDGSKFKGDDIFMIRFPNI